MRPIDGIGMGFRCVIGAQLAYIGGNDAANRRPVAIQVQSDGRIRKWGYIEEAGKYLRLVFLSDGETLHNAFFDRDFSIKEAANADQLL